MTSYKVLIRPLVVFLALSQGAAAEPVPPAGDAPPAGMGAGPGRHGMQPRPGLRRQMMQENRAYAQVILDHADQLKLTDEQVGKITRIQKDNRAPMEALGKRLRETMRETHLLFGNPTADDGAIRQSAQTHAAAFNEFLESALKARAAVNEVLTPAQREQLKTLK